MTSDSHNPNESTVREALQPWTNRLQAMEWQHGNPAEAWEHVIKTCLEHPGNRQFSPPELCAIISAAGEALASHIRSQQPWPQTGWEEYARRSLEHHNETANRETARLRNQPDRELPHRTSDINLDGLVARPIISTHQLAIAAQEMQNSLAHYAEFCEAGHTFLYTVHREGEQSIEAAVEIIGVQGTWRLGQVAGPRNIRPTRDQLAIARLVAETMQASTTNP